MSPESKKKKAAYDVQYARDHVTRKFIPFNKDMPEEKELLDWLDAKGKGNVAGYVKSLIRKDIECERCQYKENCERCK